MAHNFVLPLSVVSLVDLKRVKREIDNINDSFLQTEIRAGDDSADKLPKTSRFLDDIVDANKIDLLKKEDRQALTKQIDDMVESAPVMHMSFSAEPSPKFLERLMEWLRQSIDPYTLVIVGLAPTIGAGCMLRTTNKYFDLSLKEALLSKRDLLLQEITKTPAPVAANTQAAPVAAATPAPEGVKA